MRQLVTLFALALMSAGCVNTPLAPPARPTEAANPMDYYPNAAQGRGEQGAPIVMACVGADGKLLREPEITESSGFPELDAAAIKVAKASRYAAGTENGVALKESCIKFKVKFVIKD
jgi:TonB family protein